MFNNIMEIEKHNRNCDKNISNNGFSYVYLFLFITL